MKILFITLVSTTDINERGLYNDLLRKFVDYGHEIFVLTSTERRNKQKTQLIQTNNAKILIVKTLNIQKTNIFEKGLGTLLIESQFLNDVKKYFNNVKFDLVLYSTPPITFTKVISFIKKRDNAFAYLLLKDIFPQNAVDIGLMKKNGLIHSFFRKKEKELYLVSDKIGCMSPANVKYLLEHNKYISQSKVEVCPNTIEPIQLSEKYVNKFETRAKYNLPNDKIIFIYGGNLGKPQGIDFLIEVLESNKNNLKCFFLIVGDGTEYKKIETWFNCTKPHSARLIKFLPKNDYDNILKACDVGMIFLDVRFTIPNFPSRILSYMENAIPIIAATDINTDIGETMVEGNFGFWSAAGDVTSFNNNLKVCFDAEKVKTLGVNARSYLENYFNPKVNYNIIMRNFGASTPHSKN